MTAVSLSASNRELCNLCGDWESLRARAAVKMEGVKDHWNAPDWQAMQCHQRNSGFTAGLWSTPGTPAWVPPLFSRICQICPQPWLTYALSGLTHLKRLGSGAVSAGVGVGQDVPAPVGPCPFCHVVTPVSCDSGSRVHFPRPSLFSHSLSTPSFKEHCVACFLWARPVC